MAYHKYWASDGRNRARFLIQRQLKEKTDAEYETGEGSRKVGAWPGDGSR